MTYLITLDSPEALDANRVGQKFRSLARAAQAGFSVPAAVAVSTEAHRHFLLQERWPPGLTTEIRTAAAKLDLAQGLSVRSSAVQEDLDAQSFAGQYSTFLRIRDGAELRDRIEQVWQSADAETVRSYLRARRRAAAGDGNPLMGVVIQRMVDAVAAGVAFGRNPLRPARKEIVIEAVAGSAERLVNGELSPHRVLVKPDQTLKIDARPKAEHSHVDEPELMKPDQWLRIADMLTALQVSMAEEPLDVEWAVDSAGQLWLLQFRRITALDPSEFEVPPGAWTRRIADDLWADRLTPFLADAMLRNAPRFDMTRICTLLKFPIVRPTLAVIRGYLYVNCENLRRLIARIPVRWRTADLRAYLPPEISIDQIPGPGSADSIRSGLRGLTLLVREPGVNPLLCLQRTARNIRRIEARLELQKSFSAGNITEALRNVRLALESLARIQENNQWPYFHANLFTVMLRWLMVDCCGFSHGHFLQRLAWGADNVSIRIERRFRDMADRIRRNPDLLKDFQSRETAELKDRLPESLRRELPSFLARYGCRSRHRTLYVPRWSEAPDEVLGILQTLVKGSESRGNASNRSPGQNGSFSEHHAAESTAPRWALSTLPAVRGLSRRFLDLREELRFLLDRCLFEIRRSLLDFGRHSGLGENVLFLTIDELQKIADGSWNAADAAKTASDRKRSYLEPVAVSSFYIDGRPVEDFAVDETVFRGTGTSAGRVSGRARIITDPSKTHLHQGDIIVAENTDPGWTPILSTAVGLVVEEGGLLNHCSIVARELKIPAVVGIRGATRRIADGARLTIDGGLGLVRVDTDVSKTLDRQPAGTGAAALESRLRAADSS